MSPGEIAWRVRRSILELDVLLTRFMAEHYDNLSQEAHDFFLNLLKKEDYEILDLQHQDLPLVEREVIEKIFGQ